MHRFGKFITALLGAAALALTGVALQPVNSKARGRSPTRPEKLSRSHWGATVPRGEGMTGTWKEEGAAAIITWDTGWTTKISKEGDKYTKAAFKKGEATDGNPANSSAAEKVK